MLDIHTHIIPFVDDGCESFEQSLEMIRREKANGVTDIFCTPHYRGRFKKSVDEIKSIFQQLQELVSKEGLEVNLYLGQEISCKEDVKNLLKNGEVLTMNGGKFLLIELDLYDYCEGNEIVYSLVRAGFKPIVAHIERYPYIDLREVAEIKSVGGLIQINADAIAGVAKRQQWGFIKDLFRNGLVDFVASDLHFERNCVMAEARKIVDKKFGKDCGKVVFEMNKRLLCK